jgi:hypothetical protein
MMHGQKTIKSYQHVRCRVFLATICDFNEWVHRAEDEVVPTANMVTESQTY